MIIDNPFSKKQLQKKFDAQLNKTQAKIIIPDHKRRLFLWMAPQYLEHTGPDKLFKTISLLFNQKDMNKTIKEISYGCRKCQRCKKGPVHYGMTHGGSSRTWPLERIATDMVGYLKPKSSAWGR